MPKIGSRVWPTSREELFRLGVKRVRSFCKLNQIPMPAIVTVKVWTFDACAYYRPDTPAIRKLMTPGINLCLSKSRLRRGRPNLETGIGLDRLPTANPTGFSVTS